MRKFHDCLSQEVAKNVAFDQRQLEDRSPSELATFFRLYYSFEFALGQVLSDSDDRYHPNASFSVLTFLAQLQAIQKLCGVGARFLDVGCGLGNKVFLARELGFDAYGIEVNKAYVEFAREFVGSNRIFCQDGITYPDYKTYDVIYFYNPMPARELESAIINGARSGAVIYHAIGLQNKPPRAHRRLSKRLFRVLQDEPAPSRSRPRDPRRS